MDTENQPTNRDQGNNEPQLSPPKESISSSGDQNNRPESPATEGSSPPEEDAKKMNAPRILRTLIADRQELGFLGSSSIDEKLIRFEEFVEMNVKFFFGGRDKSENQ